jgi:hypothetical protein
MTLKLLVTPIKAVLGFPKLAPKDLLASAAAIYTGTNGNPAYPSPPVDMAALKADIDHFSSAITAAQDGGKKAIVERNRLAEVLIKKLRKLGKYVEISCNDDMKTFLSSGFEAASVARSSAPALSDSIRSIKAGPNSGQFQVVIATVPGAHSYEVRWGVVGAGGALPGAWASQPTGKTRPPALITGLTPGTNYAIQVRAVTKAGYTDWSNPVTRICT